MILGFILLLTGAAPADSYTAAAFTEQKFRQHVAALAGDEYEGRDVDTAGGIKAAEYMIKQLGAVGVRPLQSNRAWIQTFKFESIRRGQSNKVEITGRNVLGVVPGAGPMADQAIIVSTHHDHLGIDPWLLSQKKDAIFNGADDNASGCAAMLLLAEALHTDPASLPVSRRTVIFASFDAEEKGLRGAHHYVTHPIWALEKTTANLNFDMIGRLDRNRLYAFDSRSNPFLTERLQVHCAAVGLRPETRINNPGRSDHINFLERAIPAMHFCTGLHSDYHLPSDETARVDCSGGARVAQVAYRLLRDVMVVPHKLPFFPTNVGLDTQAIIRFVMKMGLIPVLDTQTGKYPLIRFVVPGSIAAKGGLQSKDEIVSINGKTFERIEDAALVFADLNLWQGLKLTVLRGGVKKEINLHSEFFADVAGPRMTKLANGNYNVAFRCKPSKAAKNGVFLAGSFNQWNITALRMTGPDKEGFYTMSRELSAGSYEYKYYLSDAREWLADPNNFLTTGQFQNSLLRVGVTP